MKLLGRIFLWFICLSVLTLSAREVRAQTVTLNERTGFKIDREKERSSSEFPLRISRQDCFDGAARRYESFKDPGVQDDYTWIVIIPRVEGAGPNDFIDVWVSEGADCSQATERNSASQACSLVLRTTNTTRDPELYVNPRDVVLRAKLKDFDPELPLPESICTDDANQVDRPLTFFILLMASADTMRNHATWKQSQLDLAAPPPPVGIDVAAGDRSLFFEWDIDAADEVPETRGFTFYCVPAGTQPADNGMGGATTGTGGDAGTGGDPGAGGSEATGGDTGLGGGGGGDTCGQGVLFAGELPSPEAMEEYECGEVLGRASRRGQADDLTNDVEYAVAVAAVDVVGNVGELSEVACLTPKDVTTFYEGYKGAGGKGGGGYCQLGSAARSKTLLVWLVLLSVSTFLLRRRRGLA